MSTSVTNAATPNCSSDKLGAEPTPSTNGPAPNVSPQRTAILLWDDDLVARCPTIPRLHRRVPTIEPAANAWALYRRRGLIAARVGDRGPSKASDHVKPQQKPSSSIALPMLSSPPA